MMIDMANIKITPDDIRRFRKQKELSQQALASILGVGVATISRWENGEAKPTGTAAVILSTLIAGSAGAFNEMKSSIAVTGGMPGTLGSGYAIYQLLKEIFENKGAQHQGQ